jgi:hypothetical protein
MPKYTVKVRPTGLLNGEPWPEEGATVNLHAGVGDPMVEAGHLEAPKPAKKAAAKKVETAVAPKADVETRKG